MFLGQYTVKFTGSGRVVLPKKLRSEIKSKEVILSRGFEGCIWGFDLKGFEKEAKKNLEISTLEERARMLRRYLFSGAMPAELDSQGRFIIPSALLTYAKLGSSEVVIIGAGDHFELWNSDLWRVQLRKVEDYGRLS